jgi:hypothetical protein
MTNRIWKMIRKKKPPQPDPQLFDARDITSPLTLQCAMQSVVSKRFVIDDEWLRENANLCPQNPHPYAILGINRTSIYNSECTLCMAPYKDDGFPDMSKMLSCVPSGKAGVAAKQS